ncbi:uncharacterized protein LOC128210025 [Mya arenaria]|uniref:uncharacterized protein LOC128210025 n=1 Tax=Mya arenaria TaxID=6604 RepID=UPI0022E81024|nr:uncharacterized protein LOC128210025 [Mya arenaria]
MECFVNHQILYLNPFGIESNNLMLKCRQYFTFFQYVWVLFGLLVSHAKGQYPLDWDLARTTARTCAHKQMNAGGNDGIIYGRERDVMGPFPFIATVKFTIDNASPRLYCSGRLRFWGSGFSQARGGCFRLVCLD